LYINRNILLKAEDDDDVVDESRPDMVVTRTATEFLY
jgi:hypothetical protein